jgi:prevent-host-death family protein
MGFIMQSTGVGIRDAKMHLSKYLKMVQQGTEVIITDRGRPVGKIIPIHTKDLPLMERIKRMEAQGRIEPITEEGNKKIPPPIPVLDAIAKKILQEERNKG